ncbi:glutamic-type intramembrane protease PrsW [Paenisporosarcina cavernae]|uniref:Protease PrsW n=1 Tax=Paenisporosarcina cavernae TaxID=2320858 RepID=A0A385YSA2_9BACL|nr:glutamic-type intramembrane protease PrsW [Paenisporosarcina cavernae]AYC29371.1 PrsW family intramembrane metalloprotease [Paenisporosarcina cavernae]
MLFLLSVAIAPGLALLSFFYLRNDIASEPSKTLFQTFLYGAILTFPLLFLQFVFEEENFLGHSYLRDVLISSSLEEFFKWFILLIAIYQHVEFDDPYDGILYGASISLGFATVENILYVFTYGVETAFFRALLPVSSHALFGVVMGYYIGKSKFAMHESKKPLLFLAIFVPLALHVLYNSILSLKEGWLIFMIPFMLFLWLLGLSKVKSAHSHALKYKNDILS